MEDTTKCEVTVVGITEAVATTAMFVPGSDPDGRRCKIYNRGNPTYLPVSNRPSNLSVLAKASKENGFFLMVRTYIQSPAKVTDESPGACERSRTHI
jgi:hypothetical protein